MRKLLISTAAALSALAVAAPASAQYWPTPQAPMPPGYAYGHQNAYGQVHSLQVRIDRLQRRIERLRERRALSRNEARNLREESRQVERRLRAAAAYGLHPRERYDIETRIARLEYHVRQEARDGRRGYGAPYGGYGSPYGGYGADRDRDGRDDRYEDDRGYYPG